MSSSEKIHICFGIHDATGKYSKYAAVTMVSILENTASSIVFHIVHDDTLSEENRKKLDDTIRNYSSSINYHRVSLDEKQYEGYDLARFTIGTLFKLMICNELKEDTERVIYLDSDIVVNLDIKELWNEDLDGKLMGACSLKMASGWPLLEKRIIGEDDYFNTGVILMDIDAINRKHDLWEECIDFILEKPDLWRAPDQDAITYVFRGEIKKLDVKYNSRVYKCRENSITDRRIYHFVADSPRDVFCYEPDRLFYNAFRKTPWGTEDAVIEHYEKRLEEKDYQKQVVYDLMKQIYEHPEKKKVFWGIGGAIHEGIMKRIPWKQGDYFVDSKSAVWNRQHGRGTVYPPNQLENENPEDTIVIVTIFRYKEVKPFLEKLGFKENVNFFNGKYLLPESATMLCAGERDNKWDL